MSRVLLYQYGTDPSLGAQVIGQVSHYWDTNTKQVVVENDNIQEFISPVNDFIGGFEDPWFSLDLDFLVDIYCSGTTLRRVFHDGTGGSPTKTRPTEETDLLPLMPPLPLNLSTRLTLAQKDKTTCIASEYNIVIKTPLDEDPPIGVNPIKPAISPLEKPSRGWDYWLFHTNQEFKKGTAGTEYKRASEGNNTVKIGAIGLERQELIGLSTLFESPQIDLLISQDPITWQTVTIAKGSEIRYKTRNTKHSFEVTLNLPKRFYLRLRGGAYHISGKQHCRNERQAKPFLLYDQNPFDRRDRGSVSIVGPLNVITDRPYKYNQARYKVDGQELITDGVAIIKKIGPSVEINLYAGIFQFFDLLKSLKFTESMFQAYDFNNSPTEIIGKLNTTEGLVWPVMQCGLTQTDADRFNVATQLGALYLADLFSIIGEALGYTIEGSLLADPFISKVALLLGTGGSARRVLEVSTNAPQDLSYQLYPVFLYYDVRDYVVPGSTNDTSLPPPAYNYRFSIQLSEVGNTFKYRALFSGVVSCQEQVTIELRVSATENLFSKSVTLEPGDNQEVNIALDMEFQHVSSNVGYLTVIRVHQPEGSTTTFASGARLRVYLLSGDDGWDTEYQQSTFFSLPDLTPTKFFKSILQAFAGIAQVDENDKRVLLTKFEDLIENKTVARDWSDKLSLQKLRDTEREFDFDGYGKTNYLRYSNDSEVDPDIGLGSFAIDNDFLEDEKDLFDLPYSASLQGSVFTTPVECAEVNFFTDAKERKPRLIYLKDENLAFSVHNNNSNETAFNGPCKSGQFKLPGEQGLHLNDCISNYYGSWVEMLQRYVRVELDFNLDVKDVRDFDFSIPVYLKQFAAYFYVQKIDKFRKGELIISVELDQEAAKKGAAEMVAEVSKLGTARQSLSKQLKELQKDENANGDAIKKVSGELAKNQRQTQEAAKKRNLYNKALKANDNSLGGLRAKNSQLRAELDKVDVTTVKGQKRFDQLTLSINKNQEVLNKADEATKNYRGSVGNYTGAIKEAFGSSQLMGGELGKLRGLYVGLLQATNAQTASQQAFNVAQDKGTRLTRLATKGLKLFKVALASTGIGLIVIALGSLIAMFKSSEEGQNKLNKITSIFGVIIGNITDVLAEFGEVIFDAISNPRKAWEDLQAAFKKGWDFIKAQVIDRFSGSFDVLVGGIQLGVAKIQLAWAKLWGNDENVARAEKRVQEAQERIIEGGKKITKANQAVSESFDQITAAAKRFADETRKEIDLAKQVADLQAETDLLERKLLVERAQIEAKVAELRLKARQEDEFTHEQRLKFLDEANNLQDQLLAKDEEAARNRLKIVQLQNSFSKSTKENLDKEAEAEAKLNQITTARFNQTRQIERERQTVRKQLIAQDNAEAKRQEAAAKKRIEDERKEALARLNDQKAAIEHRLLLVKQGSDEYLTLQRALLNKEREIALQNVNLTENQRLLLKAQFLAKESELELKQEELRTQRREEALRKDELVLELQLERKEILESEYHRRILEIREKAILDEIEKLEEGGVARLEKELELENLRSEQLKLIKEKELEEKQRLAEAEIAIDRAKIRSLQAVTEESIKLLGEQTTAGKIALTLQKSLAINDLILNLKSRQGAIFETGEKIKALAPPATIPLGSAYIAVANTAAIAQNVKDIADINGIRFDRGGIAFEGGTIPEQGGMITGRPHSTGGVKFALGGKLGEADGAKGEAYIINTSGDRGLKLRPLPSTKPEAAGLSLITEELLSLGSVTEA
ncbi:chromosome segregation ATPase [Gracilaria domingensis]|nr:chromosome segregation ATPase [Gracilaria domingensis]